MIKREYPTSSSPRVSQHDDVHALLVTLSRYAATFDLMLSAWGDRSLYEAVKEELDAVATGQKALFPEAGVAMMGLTMAHSDIAALLLEMQVAQHRGLPSKFGVDELPKRQRRHEAAVDELRSYILRKTH